MFVRHAYMSFDPDTEGFVETGLDCRVTERGEPVSRTKQEFREEVDINTIVRRFRLTGELPERVATPFSADFAEAAVDFKSAMNLIVDAQNAFMTLPAEVRERFQNDPARFVAFASDPANLDEAIKLNIVRAERVTARRDELAAARKAEIDAAVAAALKAEKPV